MNKEKIYSKKKRISDVHADIILAWLPSLVLFVIIPFAVYLSNQGEYDYNFNVVFPFVILGIFSLGITSALFFVRTVWRTRIALILFYIGVFFLLSDILSIGTLGIFERGQGIPESRQTMFLQILLVFILVVCSVKLPVKVLRTCISPLILILLIIQPFYIYLSLAKKTVWVDNVNTYPEHLEHIDPNIPGNIYHFVFDCYSSLKFQHTLKDLEMEVEEFEGFVFFQNNLSNYISTKASVPSFLTGTFYQEGSFHQWMSQGKTSGLKDELYNNGYRIWEYTPNRSGVWSYEKAAFTMTNRDLSNSYFVRKETLVLAEIAILRSAPSLLRQEVFQVTEWMLGWLFCMLNHVPVHGESSLQYIKKISFNSVAIMREFLRDERRRNDRGEYIYCHLLLPHVPHIWDRNGNYSEKSNFYEQSLYATRLMTELITELKRLGRYNNSLIIFQSDHGHRLDSKEPLTFEAPPEVIKKLRSISKLYSPEECLERLHSLLLVKPPFALEKHLVVSNAPTQLIDIPSTVYDLLGIVGKSFGGRSVFKLKDLEKREIHMYVGVWNKNEKGETVELGKQVLKAELGHFSYTNNDKSWRLYPDVSASK